MAIYRRALVRDLFLTPNFCAGSITAYYKIDTVTSDNSNGSDRQGCRGLSSDKKHIFVGLCLPQALDMFLNQTRTWVLLCVMYMPNGTSASRSIPSHRLRISQGFVGIAFT